MHTEHHLYLNAPARLSPDEGVRTEGVIFDAHATLRRRRRTPHELWLALMRDLQHEDSAAFPDLQAWLDDLKLANYSPVTIYQYARSIAELLRKCPDTRFDQFTPAQIKPILLRQGDRSRHITRSIFNVWFEWGEVEERIDQNPMRKIRKIRHPKRRPTSIYDEAEIARFEALPVRDGALVTIMFSCGPRKGGCRRLQRRDIDLDRRQMVLNEKGGKERIVAFPMSTAQVIADLDLLEGLNPTDYLWYCRPGGGRRFSRAKPIGNTTMDRWWRRVIQQAGVRYLNMHQARHTYQRRLQERTMPIEYRRFLLGHEKISTTEDQYGRTSIEDAQAVLDEVWA